MISPAVLMFVQYIINVVVNNPVGGGGGGGTSLSEANYWINYNGVAFLIEFLDWGRTISGFPG